MQYAREMRDAREGYAVMNGCMNMNRNETRVCDGVRMTIARHILYVRNGEFPDSGNWKNGTQKDPPRRQNPKKRDNDMENQGK